MRYFVVILLFHNCYLKKNLVTCFFSRIYILVLHNSVVESVAQFYPTLCDPMDCIGPGSSVHGILQERILESVAIPFSRGSSWPRDRTQVSCVAGRFFTIWATGKTLSENSIVICRISTWTLLLVQPTKTMIERCYTNPSSNDTRYRQQIQENLCSPREWQRFLGISQ